MKKPNNPWYSVDGKLVVCPVPGCEHRATIITKSHCRLEHKMEREEIEETYGMPEQINNQRWIVYE